MNVLRIEPTADELSSLLTNAIDAANTSAGRWHDEIIRTPAEVREAVADCLTGPGPARQVEWDGRAGFIGVRFGWWADGGGRRHVRVAAHAFDNAGGIERRVPALARDEPALSFVYPGVVQRVWTRRGPIADLAVCRCGALGTPDTIGWAGERCGPCQDRADEGGPVTPPAAEPYDGFEYGRLMFSPDGASLFVNREHASGDPNDMEHDCATDLVYVDLATGTRTPMPVGRRVSVRNKARRIVSPGPGGKCLVQFGKHEAAVWDVAAGVVGPFTGIDLRGALASPCRRYLQTERAVLALDWESDTPIRPLYDLPVPMGWSPSGRAFSRDGGTWVGVTPDERAVRIEVRTGAATTVRDAMFDGIDRAALGGTGNVYLYADAISCEHDLALARGSSSDVHDRTWRWLGSLSGRVAWRRLDFRGRSGHSDATFSSCGRYLVIGTSEGLAVFPTAGGEPILLSALGGYGHDWFRTLTISPDGEWIAVVSALGGGGPGIFRIIPWKRLLAAAGLPTS